MHANPLFFDEGYGFDVFGLHPASLAGAAAAAAPIYERYFRVDSQGAEQIPAEGPAILVANHGGVLPVDAAMLCLDVVRRTDPPRIPRAITDHFVRGLPLVSTLFARVGVVSGTRTNVKLLLERGELIAIWPEGVSGPAKPFSERYKLQRWNVGFAELAIRYRAPVVPVAIVGAEESWPIAARLRARVFGAPYLPIPASPLPLPARYYLRYGEPIHLDRDYSNGDADDPELVAAGAMRVRTALEALLASTLAARPGVFR
jgi:1-acyl-sn-glycerol-3-phosphate acyltransferase